MFGSGCAGLGTARPTRGLLHAEQWQRFHRRESESCNHPLRLKFSGPENTRVRFQISVEYLNLSKKPHFQNILVASIVACAVEALAAASEPVPPADVIKFAGLAPEAAAREMSLPPGFKATLFAGEPDVKQPIAFALDHRGR